MKLPHSLEVHGKLGWGKAVMVDDYRFVKAHATLAVAKQTIPSPSVLHFRGGRQAIDPCGDGRGLNDEQHRPIEQVGEKRPSVRLLERVPEGVEALLGVLDGLPADHAGEGDRLVRDEAREGIAYARDR